MDPQTTAEVAEKTVRDDKVRLIGRASFCDAIELAPGGIGNSPGLAWRSSKLVSRTLEQQGVFHATLDTGLVIGKQAFYRHSDLVGEVGSAWVDDDWQGFGLFGATLPYVVMQMYLSNPRQSAYSITEKANKNARKGLDTCGWILTSDVPPEIESTVPYDWTPVRLGAKVLYLAKPLTIARCLEHAADFGPLFSLRRSEKDGSGPSELQVAITFPFFARPDFAERLRAHADEIRAKFKL